jgi:salicylate hydroxylase
VLKFTCLQINTNRKVGAGAGQAIEDGYILGRALRDYFSSSTPKEGALAAWTQLYQDVRLPRAQKVQRTSRDAVEVYQAQADIMRDMSFDECVPEIHKRVINRMKWVWSDDIDAEYDQMVKERREAGLL